MTAFHYAGSRAGAGKTRAYIDLVIRRSRSKRNTAVVVATVSLAKELSDNIRLADPSRTVSVFHSDDGSGEAVTTRVLDFLNGAQKEGAILIITHQCFLNLPFFSRKANWRVLVDESISVLGVHKLNLHESHSLITDHIELVAAGPVYSRIKLRDKGSLQRIVDNRNNDDVWRSLKDVCVRMLRTDCECYVQAKQYNELVNGLKSKAQLAIYSLLKPDRFFGFEQVTFAAADFKDTLTYHHWERLGISWREDEEVIDGILRRVHPDNPNLTIFYGYEGRNSKNLRDRLEKDGNGELRQASIREMRGEPFLWLENKDRADTSSLNSQPNGKRLPPVSAGLNGFDTYRHAIILSAYNHDPGTADFLTRIAGFNKAMQAREMVGHLYQAFMRTALRKDEIAEEARWVVACRNEAELLSERFPGCVVKPLGLAPLENRKSGRPRKHANDNERKREYERKKKEELARCAGFAADLAPALLENVVFLYEQDETTYKTIGDFVRDFRGSYFTTYRDTNPKCITMSEKKFIRFLKDHHRLTYLQKDDMPCIAGAMFDPSRSSGNIRNQINMVFSRGIWIDVEGGDLTPQLFEEEFPQLQFVAYSTFRHTKEKPRYRIYILTNRPMHHEESVAIYHEIRCVLKNRGWIGGKRDTAKRSVSFNDRFDGIDHRPNPSQLSILPCQSEDKKASFFLDKTNGKEPLNVDAWLEQKLWFEGDDEFYGFSIPPEGNDNLELSPEQITIITEATAQWETVGRLKGNGDAGIFILYQAFRRAKLSIFEMEWRLYQAASRASSPTNRKTQVRRLIENLRRKAH